MLSRPRMAEGCQIDVDAVQAFVGGVVAPAFRANDTDFVAGLLKSIRLLPDATVERAG